MTSTKKAEKKSTPKETEAPAGFPITLREFLGEIATPESRRAFGGQMTGAGKKQRSEWKKLYNHWMAKPIGVTWATWLRNI